MGFFRVVIYGIIFGVWSGSLYYDVQYMPRVGFESWFSKLVMLTMLNFVLQTVYSTICFICAVLDWIEESRLAKLRKPGKKALVTQHVPSYWRLTPLHKACDFMYATSAFPVGMATSLLFWGLYIANPEFVIPKWATNLIPQWHNHVTHTAPVAFLLIDTLLTCHHAPSKKTGSLVIGALYLIYLSIIFYVRIRFGHWLYPVFNYISNELIFGLLVGGGLALWLLYLIGDGLNIMLWGQAPHATTQAQKVK
uniref:Androgen-induced gene 1 protein n=1 Tax=Panagrellus redivivus TaxID=6233 RepID=A0A7E5A186_PANRE